MKRLKVSASQFRIYFIASAFFYLSLILFSCKHKEKTLFELRDNTGINFTNKVVNTKDFNIFSYRNFYNGAGVATGDINNDGLPDVFFTSNMGSNKLYLNKGNFQFEDISEKAGITQVGYWNTGVVMVDIDADGWLDIYVCNAGYNKYSLKQGNAMFINNHDGTFTNKATQMGLDDNGYTTHAAFFDYDMDGDLDCYILNNSFIPVNTLNYSNKRELRAKDWPVEEFAKGGGDKLLRNDNGHFVDVSEQAHIYGSLIGFGLGVTVGDVNGDHWPDLYISNDFFERDYLYINQKDGTFKEDLEKCVQHTSLASMGADMADVNNDGFVDIFTTDMLPKDEHRLKTTTSFDGYDVYQYKLRQGFYHQLQQNTLQINNQNGHFIETAHYSGVAASDWSWGALIFDADNDGLQDIYVCNGIYKDVIDQDFIDFFANELYQKMAISGEKTEMQQIVDKMPSVPLPNKFFLNKGNLVFNDQGESMGFSKPSFSNGASYADLDNDGDLDLIVNNVNMPCFVYENNANATLKNNYISVKLKGNGKNTYALGSSIDLFCNGEILSREVIPSRGFQSSTDYKIVVGLGNKKVDSLRIIWNDRTVSTIYNPQVNKNYFIKYDSVTHNDLTTKKDSIKTIFTAWQNPMNAHVEDRFNDFYNERNVPIMLSKEGPRCTVGDVDGDGKEDLFIGGGKGQPGIIYHNSGSNFIPISSPAFEQDKQFEDVACCFFDADGDHDLDLFVGSGGNDLPPHSPFLKHRLYINDGHGHFNKSSFEFPENNGNISVAIPNDIDGDGDIDLFVGGLSLSYNYGAAPRSYIFINDGAGRFVDDTKNIAPGLENIGMVTGAVWANVIGDNQKELIVVGDWMHPSVFTYSSHKLQPVVTSLDSLFGWWQIVKAFDLDDDGYDDLVLGNIGKNFYINPTSTMPCKLWRNDFDNNGLPDKIFSKTYDNKDVPLFLKKEFTDILPSYKKEVLLHHEFAKKSLEDIFGNKLLKTSSVSLFNYTPSCIAWGNKSSHFQLQELPVQAQLSSVNAIIFFDVNKDNKPDILLGGNMTEFLPQFGRLDGNYGLLLINDGKRGFNSVPAPVTGLSVQGMVKDIAVLKKGNENLVLFLRNNDKPVSYVF